MKTINLTVWGIVQGVGFRPFLAKIAHKYGLMGWVINEGGYVKASLSGEESKLDEFLIALRADKPEPAEIVHIDVEKIDGIEYKTFEIKASSHGTDGLVMLPADLSICKTCSVEMKNPTDRRYKHPFISCMECGPRYSIIDKVPYDRHNTSMVEFPMCDKCNKEYIDEKGRRHHAQTVSCHDCGPYLKYKSLYKNEELIIRGAALEAAIADLKNGGIVAIKGIGGYHLACRPDIDKTVINLRELKGREEKPFAVMFSDINSLKEYCIVSEMEEAWLTGKEKPILLMETTDKHFSKEVSRSSRLLGAFLPYTPLQKLILEETGPLIMTSANISDEPIIIDEDRMLETGKSHFLNTNNYLTSILFNDRKIRTGEDDSVGRVYADKFRLIRRARGFVPVPLYIEALRIKGKNNNDITHGCQIFATGGQLKNTFCMSKGAFLYLSQHHGDLEDLKTNDSYLQNTERFQEMLRFKPEIIACDMHPRYFTTDFAKKYAAEKGISLLKVQHHHAHAASVAAEHFISEMYMGIVFDGTGYGTDGKIWGGEFLICRDDKFERFAHLDYVKVIGGDASMKEAWKSGMAYLVKSEIEYSDETEIKPEFRAHNMSENWKIIKSAIKNGINTIESSSMGRLFDAVSFLLGLADKSEFEGEAAILLENKANEFSEADVLSVADVHSTPDEFSSAEVFSAKTRKFYELVEPISKEESIRLSFDQGIRMIIEDIKKTNSSVSNSCANAASDSCINSVSDSCYNIKNYLQKKLACEFHENLVNACVEVSKKAFDLYNLKTIVLSGGVFQNRYLLEKTTEKLEREGFKVYSNEKVPVNDGGISLGQAFIAALTSKKKGENICV